jgi:hypothetical protein
MTMRIDSTSVNLNVQSTTPAQPASPSTSQAKPDQTATTDTVQISSAGKAAVQEATESRTQTLKEAQGGDMSARKKLAKEEATEVIKE